MVNVVYFAREYISSQSEQIGRVEFLIDQKITKMFISGIFVAVSQILHISWIHLLVLIGDLRCIVDILE